MGLSNAWNVATTSLATNAGLTSIVSRNISNAQNSTGYVSAKVANLVTGSSGAAVIQSIADLTNASLFNSMLSSTSANAAAQALSNGVTQLQQTVSRRDYDERLATTAAASPSSLLQTLSRALQTYSSSPGSSSAASAVFSAAQNLGQRLERGQRDHAECARDGGSGHGQFRRHDKFAAVAIPAGQHAIVNGTATGADVSDALRPAQYHPAKPVAADRRHHDDRLQWFDVDLYRQRRHPVRHHPAQRDDGCDHHLYGLRPRRGGLCRWRAGDGRQRHHADPVRRAGRPRQSARHRRHAISEPARFHRRRTRQRLCRNQPRRRRTIAGPVHLFAGATSIPGSTLVPGLASEITVSSAVDPAQGGNLNLIRDGGINGAAYVQNSTGAAGYNTLIAQRHFRADRDPGLSLGDGAFDFEQRDGSGGEFGELARRPISIGDQ